MANVNVPGKPRLQSVQNGEVRIDWVTPARNGFAWNVYASIAGVAQPLPGPALNATPVTSQSFRFNLESVAGNSPPSNDIQVAVTSVNLTSLQESAQSDLLVINVDAGDPAQPNLVTVGRSPSGQPTYLATDEDGFIRSTLPTGGATEAQQAAQLAELESIDTRIANQDLFTTHKQTTYTLTAVPTDLTGAGGALTTPLAGRKSVEIQNRTGGAIFVGDATGQEHRINNNDSKPFFGCTAAVSIYGRTGSGSGTITIWEFAE